MPNRRSPGYFLLGIVFGNLLLTAGCATSNCYLVDPGGAAALHVETATMRSRQFSPRRTQFDAAGGRVDPDSLAIRGLTGQGEPVSLPLAEVSRLTFSFPAAERGLFLEGDLSPLREGYAWSPEGGIRFVALSDGQLRDLRKVWTDVDVGARVVYCMPRPDNPEAIPFANIAYVEMGGPRSARTTFIVIGVLVVAIGVVAASMSSFEVGGGFGQH